MVSNTVYQSFPDAVAAIVVCVIFPVIASIAVLLRIVAQKGLKRNKLGADDYFIIAGLVISVALCVLGIWGAIKGGFGWPLKYIAKYGVSKIFAKVVFAGQILWATSVTFVRLGLLLFYRRIFVTRPFKTADTILMIITGCWWIAAFVTTICSFSWDRTVQNTINYPVWLIASGVTNMLLDIATLSLPLFVIRTLQMSPRAKVMVSGIFSLGIFCVVASIMRLVYFVRLKNLPETDRQLSTITFYCFIWSVIEPNTSIIAACLPTFTPLVKEFPRIKSFLSSKFSSFTSRRSSKIETKTTNSRESGSTQGPKAEWESSSFGSSERIHREIVIEQHRELRVFP
ncbi:hypothetical protein B0J14DRAFT_372320 [Halenospora varia]|nr:hypothetical protein B0J14DRAFT_372320 [Halenospora varia]